MDTLLSIVAFTALGGVASALAAAVFLLLPQARRDRAMPHLVSLATGALLATAHGGAGGHVIAQLCPATGAVRATWRHAELAGAPNALALL